MSKLFYYKDTIINFLLTLLFGMRVEGEPINLEYGVEQPKRTCAPKDQPADQFIWMRELRVSSLHGVNQHVFL
jgi:hypothetical protein